MRSRTGQPYYYSKSSSLLNINFLGRSRTGLITVAQTFHCYPKQTAGVVSLVASGVEPGLGLELKSSK